MKDNEKKITLLEKLTKKKIELIEEMNILIQQLKDLDYGIFILLNKDKKDDTKD